MYFWNNVFSLQSSSVLFFEVGKIKWLSTMFYSYTSDFGLEDCPGNVSELEIFSYRILSPFLSWNSYLVPRWTSRIVLESSSFLPCIPLCIVSCSPLTPGPPTEVLASTSILSVLRSSGLLVFFMLYGNSVFRIIKPFSLVWFSCVYWIYFL